MLHPLDQLDDGINILIRFRRETHHEVEPQVHHIIFDEFFNRGKDLLCSEPLADHIPETLRSGLRCEGDGLHSRFLQERYQGDAQAIKAERADGHRSSAAVQDRTAQGDEIGVVRDGRA